MKNVKYIKIYEHIYDNAIDRDGNKKPNKLLGEFEIIYGDTNDYAFSVIGVEKETGKIYNIIGDEVSGMYENPNAGTENRLVEIVLHKERCC